MAGTIKKFLIGASVAASMSAIAVAPATAYTLSGSDVLKFEAVDTNNDGLLDTTQVNQSADLNSLLQGNCVVVANACSPAGSPGGNIELFASSEQLNLAQFKNSSDRTSIVGTVAGKNLTVSSLTATDWFGADLNTSYTANTFATEWFGQFYNAAGVSTNLAALITSSPSTVKTALYVATGNSSWLTKTNAQIQALAPQIQTIVREAAYNTFLGDTVKGFQRSSDPNISYITTSGSDLLIGLAGHYDAKAFYAPQLGSFGSLINNGFQVSEVVKVNYGGIDQLLYSFSASQSGLTNSAGAGADGKSHSGNYEVKLAGVVTPPPPTADVPEPSTMLALIGLGGFFAAKRKQVKNA